VGWVIIIGVAQGFKAKLYKSKIKFEKYTHFEELFKFGFRCGYMPALEVFRSTQIAFVSRGEVPEDRSVFRDVTEVVREEPKYQNIFKDGTEVMNNEEGEEEGEPLAK
jgi:hypothetical protein